MNPYVPTGGDCSVHSYYDSLIGKTRHVTFVTEPPVQSNITPKKTRSLLRKIAKRQKKSRFKQSN